MDSDYESDAGGVSDFDDGEVVETLRLGRSMSPKKREKKITIVVHINADQQEIAEPEWTFSMKPSEPIEKLSLAYCARYHVARGDVRFVYGSSILEDRQTPNQLGLGDEDAPAGLEGRGGHPLRLGLERPLLRELLLPSARELLQEGHAAQVRPHPRLDRRCRRVLPRQLRLVALAPPVRGVPPCALAAEPAAHGTLQARRGDLLVAEHTAQDHVALRHEVLRLLRQQGLLRRAGRARAPHW